MVNACATSSPRPDQHSHRFTTAGPFPRTLMAHYSIINVHVDLLTYYFSTIVIGFCLRYTFGENILQNIYLLILVHHFFKLTSKKWYMIQPLKPDSLPQIESCYLLNWRDSFIYWFDSFLREKYGLRTHCRYRVRVDMFYLCRQPYLHYLCKKVSYTSTDKLPRSHQLIPIISTFQRTIGYVPSV